MTVFPRLLQAYRSEGFEIVSGLNGTLYDDLFTAPFTRLVRDGRSISDGLGISLQELWLFEHLAAASPARTVLVIGNSFGWSTLALALAHPGARVIALDAGVDDYSVEGVGLTNDLAGRLGVDVRAVLGRSPDDVASVLERTGIDQLDLVFVDGLHTRAQLQLDWGAVAPFLAPRSLVLCHDTLMLELEQAFLALDVGVGWERSVLHATTSGIGALHREQPAAVTDLLAALSVGWSGRAAVAADAAEQGDAAGHRHWQAVVREHHALHGE